MHPVAGYVKQPQKYEQDHCCEIVALSILEKAYAKQLTNSFPLVAGSKLVKTPDKVQKRILPVIKNKASEHLCLFAHFDKGNVVDDYVIKYVSSIHNLGFDVIFVSTSKLSDEELNKVRPHCRQAITRSNSGHDFGSWSLGFRLFSSEYEGQLLLANDSVYCIVDDLGPVLAQLRSLPGLVRGMVESLQSDRHIQSWFILFDPLVHHSALLKAFFLQDFSLMNKAEIIQNGEVRLSKSLIESGYGLSTLFSFDGRFKSYLLNYNPSHSAWKQLLNYYNIPFIKVELLRENPLQLSNLASWRTEVDQRSPDMVVAIERHLSRTSANWDRLIVGKSKLWNTFSHQGFIARDIDLRIHEKLFLCNLNESVFNSLQPFARIIYYLVSRLFKKVRLKD
jgi:hypothetical protein